MRRAPTQSYPGINLGEGHASAHKATEVVTFGFWVFLMSDLVYIGLMFAIYITMIDAQSGGPGPHELFDLKSIFAQTLILLTSSLTVGLAMLALKYCSHNTRRSSRNRRSCCSATPGSGRCLPHGPGYGRFQACAHPVRWSSCGKQ